MVAGLGFGDEGKGATVDWLVRRHRAGAVVRYNGGPQAAHHVVDEAGRSHCFAQFGAGTLIPGVRTHIARNMVVDPLALVAEERALVAVGVSDGYPRLSVDPECVLVTPFHRIINQMQELARAENRHGSCGRGIAQARLDSETEGLPAVRVADALAPKKLAATLRLLWRMKLDLAEQIVDAHPARPGLAALLADLRRADRASLLTEAFADVFGKSGLSITAEPVLGDTVVLEGAQGVLLDRDHGFWPHVTPSRTTFVHAVSFLDTIGRPDELIRVGVIRAYATRHGAGPLPTEDADLTTARPDRDNRTHQWQGAFRLGWFDAVATRYALRACGGVDALVMNHIDQLAGLERVRLCTGYRRPDGKVWRDLEPPGHDPDERLAFTETIRDCRPEFVDLPGWSEADTGFEKFVSRVESAEGLASPVDAIAVGPRAGDRRLRRSGHL